MSASRKALIIGEHPIRESMEKQFVGSGYTVTRLESLSGTLPGGPWNNIVILSTCSDGNALAEDARSVDIVNMLSAELGHGVSYRPVVHLLLHSQETLRLLNTREYNDDWHKAFELDAFTLDDMWAKNVICGAKGLDYVPIVQDCDKTVHLVIFGTSSLATALAEHTALVAHYPNYPRDHSLRTRITVIGMEACEWGTCFTGRHRSLLDNSYYRFIDVHAKICDLHRPMYEGQREDFVDIEWEFVTGSLNDTVVRDKLLGWAADSRRVLSVALCNADDTTNISEAFIVADLLCADEIPIYVKQRFSAMSGMLFRSPRFRNVIPIGMEDSGYDVTLPHLRMAKRVNFVYDYCYANNIVSGSEDVVTCPSVIDEEKAEKLWLKVGKAVKRYSNVCNAMTLPTKMRSLGHSTGSGDTFYAITAAETAVISVVEHNRWSVEEMLLGFRPCTDTELSAIGADISLKSDYKQRMVHYDLVAYDDLRPDETGKNVNTYDICLSASIPLIAYDCNKEEGGCS